MDRNVKLGIVIALVITVIGGLIYFNNHQEKIVQQKKERSEMIRFVNEHNSTLESKIEEIQKTEKVDNNYSVNVKKHRKIKKYEDGTEREVLPYTKELPPMPDEEENNSTLFGVDSNNNGVRDDLEIMVVKKFGDDRDLVESFFASLRADNYDNYLAKEALENNNGHISDEDIQKIIDDIHLSVRCIGYYDSKTLDILIKSIHEKEYNTPERKKIDKVVMRNLRGGGGDPEDITDKTCKDYIEKTKTYEFSN